MTGFDYTIIAILLASMLLGLWRGLVYESLSLAGWPIAFILSKLFAPSLAPMMAGDATMQIVLAYVVVFIAALLLWSALVWLVSRLMKAVGLGGLDRVLGGVFGLVRGVFVVLALVWLAGVTSMPEQPFWRDAKSSRAAEDIALWGKVWLPDNVAQRIHYRVRS